MDANTMISKIIEDYKDITLNVNSSIKYRFMYNGYQTDIFYTTEDELKNQLLLSITVDGVDFISTLYFTKRKNTFCMKAYLPSELYNNVKFTLLFVEGKCSTTPYFNAMEQSVMNNKPIQSNYRADIVGRNLYRYNDSIDNPFFETIVRKHMSSNMIKKIKNKYDSELCKEIFQYCGNTKTLRFTPDFTKAKDIVSFMMK